MKLIIIILILGILALLAFLEANNFRRRRERDKAEYDKKYETISHIVDTYEIDEKNYDWICSLLCNLLQTKYKNKEKSQVLVMKFLRRFEPVIKRGSDVI